MAFGNNREGKLDHAISFLEKSRPGMARAIENHEQIKAKTLSKSRPGPSNTCWEIQAWAIEALVKIPARAIENH